MECSGLIAMPVIRKLKEEYYEGNTSESCRLQLILCRSVNCNTAKQTDGNSFSDILKVLKSMNP